MPKLTAKNPVKFPMSFYIITIFLIMILAILYLTYEANKRLTITNKKNFISSASANLITLNQSLEEVANATKIADSNYTKILGNSSSQSINYQPIIEDNQKTLHQISLVQGNLKFQKENITKEDTPTEYLSFKNDFLNYQRVSAEYLNSLEKKFEFENIILDNLETSQSQNLTQTRIWTANNTQTIVDFFKTLNDHSKRSLISLLALDLPSKYQDYYSLQVKYLELIVSASDEIISILESNNDAIANSDATNLEIAYKVASDSQNNINSTVEEILSKRSNYFSLQESKEDLDKLANLQNDLETAIKNSYQLLYLQSK